MRVTRRLTVLIAAGLLATGPASAWAQGADEDPFGQTDTGQTSTGPADAPPLTSTPQGAGADDGEPAPTTPPPLDEQATGPGGSQGGSATNGPRVRELPRTGLDTRTVVLLGLALLLAGVGLRLRTADERF